MAWFSAPSAFVWSANDEGLAIRFADVKHYAKAKQGRANDTGQLGLIRMQLLAEGGQAKVQEVDAGIFLAAADAVRLDLETRKGFQLPPSWPGGMRLQTGSVPQSPGFTARLGLVDPGAQLRWDWRLRGPILEVLASSQQPHAAAAPLDLPAALRLSWRLFEALTAVLYEREAERVILTPGGSDHGCDVVVLGWGSARENVLIQCKATARDELDSEAAVREVEGARPFYENALGISFRRRCLHTNARRLSRRTLQAAALCGVSVHDRAWLAEAVAKTSVSLPEVLAKEAGRERVG